MFGFFRERRRARLRAATFPDTWEEALRRHVPYFRKLPEVLQQRLRGHIQVFLAEKHFEGCGGLVLTDHMRLSIAAHACILLLGEDFGFYRGLVSILLYPAAFVPLPKQHAPSGVVDDEPEEQEGESWDRGAVVLSWEDVQRDVKAFDGRNVLFHEFSHQLYDCAEDAFETAEGFENWITVFQNHYERHLRDVERGRETFLDEYGAEDPAEFFAVATEDFFERPLGFRRRHPDLYAQFSAYYRQDPASYFLGDAP